MKKTICIDAGHGGKDSGAMGPNGLREADVTLGVALLLESLLVEDFNVVQTRRTDKFIELGMRAAIANDSQADAFLSIHCNSGDPGSGDGFEVYTTRGLTASDAMATDLFTAYAAEFVDKRARMDLSDGDPDKEAGFAVLTRTHMRAALFELEFIHTMRGESWLGEPKNQARCAKALAAGIRAHFGISQSDQLAVISDQKDGLLPELVGTVEQTVGPKVGPAIALTEQLLTTLRALA